MSGPADATGLPKAEFAFPGRLRDRLVAAILDGSKTSTTGLAVEYELEDEPLPQVGDRSVLVDSDDQPIAVLEVTSVRVVPLVEVDPPHARDEGEGAPDSGRLAQRTRELLAQLANTGSTQ